MPTAIKWLPSRAALTQAIVCVLLLVGAGLTLLTAPVIALQYWYLMAAPLALAAFYFGKRGALLSASWVILVLILVFLMADRLTTDATIFLSRLLDAVTSPQDARALAQELANVRSQDPQTAFGRALLGTTLLVIISVVLGEAIDTRARLSRRLDAAGERLRRYVSPQVVDSVFSGDGAESLEIPSIRKEVTILFADLRDFTPLAESLEPEDIVRFLNEFFTAMAAEVQREGGMLNKYLGDGFLAVFGDPIADPDHPERAFRCALAMQQRIQELQVHWQTRDWRVAGMGVGIATGYAVLGNTGSPSKVEYTAIGSIVNVASRLSDLARSGQILTTRKTFWRVEHMVGGLSRGPVTVKGFVRPLELVEITGSRAVTDAPSAPGNQYWRPIIQRIVSDPGYRAQMLRDPETLAEWSAMSKNEQLLLQQVALIIGYPLLHGIPPEEISNLIAAGTLQQQRGGSIVAHEDTQEEQFYLILQGDVAVVASNGAEVERPLASLGTGNHFGEISLLFDTPRTATVRTSSPCVFLVLNKENFYQVLATSPALKERLQAAAEGRMQQRRVEVVA